MKYFITSVLVLVMCQFVMAQDTVKVMYYNVLNYPGSTPERVNYFRTIMQYSLPDVLLITEMLNEEGADDLLNLGLNAGAVDYYERAPFSDGPDTDNMLYFNSNKFSLRSQNVISTVLRDINEYILYKKGPDLAAGDTVFMRFFVAHLKSSTGSSNEQQRLEEVMEVGQYLADNGITENYVLVEI